MFYGFLLNMWMRKKITESQVTSYVPKFITESEAESILVAPQYEE